MLPPSTTDVANARLNERADGHGHVRAQSSRRRGSSSSGCRYWMHIPQPSDKRRVLHVRSTPWVSYTARRTWRKTWMHQYPFPSTFTPVSYHSTTSLTCSSSSTRLGYGSRQARQPTHSRTRRHTNGTENQCQYQRQRRPRLVQCPQMYEHPGRQLTDDVEPPLPPLG